MSDSKLDLQSEIDTLKIERDSLRNALLQQFFSSAHICSLCQGRGMISPIKYLWFEMNRHTLPQPPMTWDQWVEFYNLYTKKAGTF